VSPDNLKTTSTRLQVRKWEHRDADDRRPLPIIKDVRAELPEAHDPAREAAKARAIALSGARKARGCSALVDGGFCVIVEF
jgi:hypothetical protein